MSIKWLPKTCFLLCLLLATPAVYAGNQTQNFQTLLAYFEDLPNKVSNQLLQEAANTGKNVANYFHDNNYQQFANRIVPIGKLTAGKNHVLVVGEVDQGVSSNKSVMYVNAFLITG